MADNELDKAIEEILERFMYSFTHLDDPMDLRLTTTALKTLLTSEKNKARGCVDCKKLRCENCERLWQT